MGLSDLCPARWNLCSPRAPKFLCCLFDFAETGLCSRMSTQLSQSWCVVVKVGYILLLGHITNPADPWLRSCYPSAAAGTLAPLWRPPGLWYRCQRAWAAWRCFHMVATLKLCFLFLLIVLKLCNDHPRRCRPRSVATDELTISAGLILFFAFGWPVSCWQTKQQRLHLKDI